MDATVLYSYEWLLLRVLHLEDYSHTEQSSAASSCTANICSHTDVDLLITDGGRFARRPINAPAAATVVDDESAPDQFEWRFVAQV